MQTHMNGTRPAQTKVQAILAAKKSKKIAFKACSITKIQFSPPT